MREKVNGFVGVMAVAILCMVSGLCMVWGIAPVVLAVYVAACAVCGSNNRVMYAHLLWPFAASCSRSDLPSAPVRI